MSMERKHQQHTTVGWDGACHIVLRVIMCSLASSRGFVKFTAHSVYTTSSFEWQKIDTAVGTPTAISRGGCLHENKTELQTAAKFRAFI